MLRTSTNQQELPESASNTTTNQKSNTFFSKTYFGVFGQASVGVSLIAASLHGITSSLGNNSAVFFYLCYIKSKNAEVKEKNKKIQSRIQNLRGTLADKYPEKPINVPAAKQESSYKNLWGIGTKELFKDSLTYMLLASLVADLANAGMMFAFLRSFEKITISDSTSTSSFTEFNNSTTSNFDVDAIEKVCTCGDNILLGRVAAALGGTTVLLAFPQVVAAHNLRKYQDELRRERKQLKILIDQYCKEQLAEQIKTLKVKNTELSNSIASLFQVLGLFVREEDDPISKLQELHKIFQEAIVVNPELQPTLQEAQQRLRCVEQHPESSKSHHKRTVKGGTSHISFFSEEETSKDSRSDDATPIASSTTDQTKTQDQTENKFHTP